MRIAFVCPYFYPATSFGGGVLANVNYAKAAAKNDIDVKVYTTNSNGTSRLNVPCNIPKNLERNLSVTYFNESILNRFSWNMFFCLPNSIKDCDIVHANEFFSFCTIIAILSAKFQNKPLLLTPHGSLGEWALKKRYLQKRLWINFLIRPFLRMIHFHATSEQEKKEILILFPKARIYLIPCPYQIEADFDTMEKKEVNTFLQEILQRENKFKDYIFSMSRLHYKKGFDLLIRAFKMIHKQYPETALLIAGNDYGEKKKLEKLILEKQLKDSVFLIGYVSGEKKWNLLSHAKLFALPSHNENFGYVYIEALIAGTPIIASKNTPWAIVEEKQCGRWIDNTIEEIAETLDEMLQSNLQAMGMRGQSLVKDYDLETVGELMKKCYTTICSTSNNALT